jgi:hypothetical protein
MVKAMDLEKSIKLTQDYASDYLVSFLATLQKPRLRFAPLVTQPDGRIITLPSGKQLAGARLDPRLLSFVVVSIFLGYQFFSVSVVRVSGEKLITVAVIVIFYWLLFGCLVHVLCKLLGGTGNLLDTLSVSLQILATLYVVGGLASLIAYALMQFFSWHAFGQLTGGRESFFAYLLVHDMLFGIYLPLALARIHSFGWARQVAVAAFTLVGSFLKIFLFWVGPYVE